MKIPSGIVLLPCPFCGANAEMYEEQAIFFAACSNTQCGVEPCTDECETSDEAAQAWNCRWPVVQSLSFRIVHALSERWRNLHIEGFDEAEAAGIIQNEIGKQKKPCRGVCGEGLCNEEI